MVNSVIMTVYVEDLNVTMDMELPCYVPIRDLEIQMLNELKARYSTLLLNRKGIRLCWDNRPIDRRRSLADENLWDGQYLTVKVEV